MARQQRDGLGSADASEEDLTLQFHHLNFSVQKSRRYHEKLSAFYGKWRDRMRVVTAVAGSGAFFVVVGGHQRAAEWITAFVALWAVLDIIIMPDKKHDLHNELCKKFTGLAAKVHQVPQTQQALRELTAERLLIEEAEPPCKRLVDLEARNDECRAQGMSPDELAPLTGPQRFFGYYGASFGMRKLEKWKADRQRQLAASSNPQGAAAGTP
jgi:chromosome condensin MukBEF ATPase and DNA-binding subunit MukB